MAIKSQIQKNTYVDSMSLMALSTKINQLPMIEQAMIGMGTDMNKQVIENVGLMTEEIKTATKADLILVIQTKNENDLVEAFAAVEVIRNTKTIDSNDNNDAYSSLDRAVQENEASNLVIFSIPGEYVAKEVKKALDHDKNIMIFSDNVSIEEELALKQYAHEKQLLVMGPDCGTAIINGVGLCFANKVRRGNIGIVAASGTGSQEVSTQIDTHGSGVSQLIGVGGRDLSEKIGGIMMADGLAMLSEDEETKVIVLISKPPAKSVQDKIIQQAAQINKPVVICFIGANLTGTQGNIVFTKNTKEAAIKAVETATGTAVTENKVNAIQDIIKSSEIFSPEQQYVRGLFAGGTICDEVFFIIQEQCKNVYSNVAGAVDSRIQFGEPLRENAMIDFGSDEYTQGHPHPMIDPTFRAAAIIEQSNNPEVAVLLLDFELGFGANENPVGGMMIDSIKQAKANAKKAGRNLEIVAYVLGTEADFQNKGKQLTELQEAGVKTVDCAVDLGLVAAEFLNVKEGR